MTTTSECLDAMQAWRDAAVAYEIEARRCGAPQLASRLMDGEHEAMHRMLRTLRDYFTEQPGRTPPLLVPAAGLRDLTGKPWEDTVPCDGCGKPVRWDEGVEDGKRLYCSPECQAEDYECARERAAEARCER